MKVKQRKSEGISVYRAMSEQRSAHMQSIWPPRGHAIQT